MPFTANRQYKADPRMVVSAEGMYYQSHDGRRILDATSGLWCSNLGHRHPKVVAAIKQGLDTLDFAPSFQFGHPKAFEFANRVAEMMPGDLNRVFFCNSGSEAADTALKIAIAYHRARGEGQRTRLIGRERGYHGVGFGGTSVGGMVANRKVFGSLLPGVDHIRHTHDVSRNAFSRGQPAHGADLADDLERLVALHDASTIAAVIVEPVAGSAGVLPPPVGYLERLREICTKHGILLIFDEVITAWGRLGYASASERLGIKPDMITMAKGITSAHVPMGAVVATDAIYDAFMAGPDHMIELFHGYTYSGHPLACFAGLATLQAYKEEGIFERVRENEGYFEDLLHDRLGGLDLVTDVRNMGYMAGVDLLPVPGAPTKRAFTGMVKAYERNMMVRFTGDTIAFSPPLISERRHLEEMVDTIAKVVTADLVDLAA
ncbi:aspartate aminotransferase family protein [Marinivivus vitaminiproducens]|uniref:aspartate aminotransferase family protein n=1 Tax=Marinivivus vitaminiproducens TaxID=3035935 RepID=UPI002799529B|nr:aspartate aminotransferase family protein [Geminicoccaceae bacterium SCSIO 64248]